jgi:glycerate-2-kinase
MMPREVLTHLYQVACDAVDPYRAVLRQHSLNPGLFTRLTDDPVPKLTVISLGKAAFAMARALCDLLGDSIFTCLACSPYTPSNPDPRITFLPGNHPIPGDDSLIAGKTLLCTAQSAPGPVIFLISGGGSACAEVPVSGLSLADLQNVSRQLLACGADIREINTVRRAISQFKGGGLLRSVDDRPALSLVLSDVINGSPADVASGPTFPNPTTRADALAVLHRYNLLQMISGNIPQFLHETDDHVQTGAHDFRVIGDNQTAINAAAEEARHLGLSVQIVSEPMGGEARDMGRRLARLARECDADCLIAGGETTVTIRGNGKGGRNQELALGFMQEMQPGLTVLSASTDGIDGPTDAAGAFADGVIRKAAINHGLDIEAYLQQNDSYSFMERTGGLFMPGPTGTNVCDLAMILRDRR